jgi:hypothetical protein
VGPAEPRDGWLDRGMVGNSGNMKRVGIDDSAFNGAFVLRYMGNGW